MTQDFRTFFLNEFTRELIFHSKKERREVFPFHPVKPTEEFGLPLTMEIPRPSAKPILPEKSYSRVKEIETRIETQLKQKIFPASTQPQQRQPLKQVSQTQISFPQKISLISPISPSPQPLPPDFSLGKLNPLIFDNKITSIECPGPGKPVLVKILGRVNTTQLFLSEEEIKKVIELFSIAAKIPLLGGIFKAAIGNLVITAVISDFVGSRFIINKYTPYSLLEQVPQAQQMPFR